MEGPGDRRVGGDADEPEEVLADAEVLDVKAALAATGECERHLDEDLAAVVNREAPAAPGNGRRERITEPQSIGESREHVQPEMGHDTGPAGFHDDATRAGTVHLGSALLVGIPVDSTPTVSPTGRAFPRMRGDQLSGPSEEARLAAPRPTTRAGVCGPNS